MPIYMDNAATSWPKHSCVFEAMQRYLREWGANPGRSGHSMSVAAAYVIFEARERLAKLFNAGNPERVIFTKNATEALNTIIFGTLKPGDHAVTTSMEHNSVMRPLRYLESKGVVLTIVPCSGTGELDPQDLKKAITSKTKLIIITHGSNVTGTVLPIRAVGMIAREQGIPFAVDAAQTAGSEPLDMKADYIDYLAFTGHKALGGPQGTGGIILGDNRDLSPLTYGGTGSLSEFEVQPEFLPDKLESGTLNGVGIAGLGAAVGHILATGVDVIKARKQTILRQFLEGVAAMPEIEVYGAEDPLHNSGVVSLNIKGVVCSEAGYALDKGFGILTRTGLHCAPSAHKTLGTFPQGTVRFSFSAFNTREEVDTVLAALRQIVSMAGVVK